MNNFDTELKERTAYVEKIVYDYCPKEEGLQKIIIEAMNYSLKAGGKRLRPMLVLETLRLFGGDEKEAYPFMAAMEMIHTYSLVHDDLPAMDNDMYRRGKKTTHAVYGEDIGILAGDGLLNMAYETMSMAILKSKYPQRAALAMNILAYKAGIYGMIGGQTVDVINENKEKDIDTINCIHKLKTAALIEGAMMVGAILAGVDEQAVETVEEIATNVGIAFQIQDDILDVTSTLEMLGKPIGSDAKNHKTTYVTLKGLEESRKEQQELSLHAIETIRNIGYSNDFLMELVTSLITREK